MLKAVVGVVDGFGLAPGGLDRVVEVGDLLEVVDGAGPDFGPWSKDWRMRAMLAVFEVETLIASCRR
jgi:hypothetical protein